MVYVSSLAVAAKKALDKDPGIYQAPFSTIIRQLQIDPASSGMDCVLLGPGDLSGQNKNKFIEATKDGIHPSICIMYIYQKESDAKDVNIHYKKNVRRIKPSEIKTFYQESWTDFLENRGDLDLDVSALSDPEAEDITVEENNVEIAPVSEVPHTDRTYKEEVKPESVEVPPLNLEDTDNNERPSLLLSSTTPEEVEDKKYKRDDMLQNIKSVEDWELLKEALQKDSITKELINENAEYNGTLQMLDALDKKISAIYFDTALSADQKFEQIREIGLKKSELRSISNSVSANRIIDVIDNITKCAQKVIAERIDGINSAMAKLTADKAALTDTARLDNAIQERTDIHLELIEMLGKVYNLYDTMTGTVTSEIEGLDDKLPSDNPFINNMVRPVDSSVFTPINTADLATKLLRALQENRISLSAVESEIRSIIDLLYALYDRDQDLHNHYSDMIHLLKAQNVEDAVIVDCVLKNVLHVYVGAENTGRTSTALIRSGVLSRRANTILIDLTCNPKYERYGVKPMTIQEFLSRRLEKDFVVIATKRRLSSEDISELLSEVKTRLNFYKYINVVVEDDDEDAIAMLTKDARTINYITDCSVSSIEKMNDCISKVVVNNVGQKLIMIDTPVNPLHIAKALNIDPTKTKLIMIPNVAKVRACALQRDTPYEHKDIVAIYEEAFK